MASSLREQLLCAMFRARKSVMDFPHMPHANVNMAELAVIGDLTDSCLDMGINIPEIQNNLRVSKAAISQMLGSLEKKGYIVRGIDKTNRRKITVTLTEAGASVVNEAKGQADQMLDKIISRFGEENTKQLLALFNRLTDVVEDMKKETVEASACPH